MQLRAHSFLVDRFDDPPRRLWERCALRFCDSDPNVNAPQGSGAGVMSPSKAPPVLVRSPEAWGFFSRSGCGYGCGL